MDKVFPSQCVCYLEILLHIILTTAHRRKLQAKVSVSGPSSNPVPATSIPPSLYTVGTSTTDLLGGSEGQDESSGGEDGDTTPQWNWREDERSEYTRTGSMRENEQIELLQPSTMVV